MMLLQGHKIIERVSLLQLAGMDQAHEDVSDPGTAESLVKEGVAPMQYRAF